MLRLLATLDLSKYTPRVYVMSETDRISEAKVKEFEAQRASADSGQPPQVREHRLLADENVDGEKDEDKNFLLWIDQI